MRSCERWTIGLPFLMFVFMTTVAYGQSLPKPLRFITTKDGMPQSFVSGLVQDKDGFVWIGTADGMARYDGLHMKIFRHSNSDTASLASNSIYQIQIDRQNRIWLFYEGYFIDCFDPVTEKVTHVSNGAFMSQNPSLARFHIATYDDHFWISRNDGLSGAIPNRDRVDHFSAKAGQIENDTILAMLEDRRNDIWTVTAGGISRYQPGSGHFQLFPAPYPLKLITTALLKLNERSNGELMLADREKIVIFNPANGNYRTIPLTFPTETSVFLIQTGPDGKDYIQTREILYSYDDKQGLVPVLKISDYSIWHPTALLVDRSGLLWLGLDINGIAQFDLAATVFDVYPNAGLFHRTYFLKEFGQGIAPFLARLFPAYEDSTSSSLLSYLVRSAWNTRSQEFYIGYKDQVARYDPADQHWQMLTAPVRGLIRGIDIAPDGKLWVMDQHSVCNFDEVKQEWNTYLSTANKDIDISLLFNCTSIKADGEKLWITGYTGLVRVDVATRHIDVFNRQKNPDLLPTNDLLGMETDPTRPHLLWINSRDGLICLNKKTLATEVFSTKQALPNNTIYAIQTDKNGYLWLSTNQGLCRFHPVTHAVRNFTIQNGLPGNEFNTLQYLKLKDGRLAFGGVDGWVAFDPAIIKVDTFQPQVAFTGFKIYNEPVTWSPGNKLLPQPLNDIEKLVLPYDQNTLTFEFAGLQYNQPVGLKYRYRLEGYDENWIITDNPIAGYTKLTPANYTLQINCTNTTGQWSNHVRSLQVVVLPPWWRTWWAYTLYALIIAGIGYALYRAWLQRVRAKQQIILQQKEAEQLKAVDEMKTRFFSNITHEFRTPLSLILGPAEQMQKEEPSPGWKPQIGRIQRNARQMLQLINQLLDMAKLEANSMKLVLHRGNLNDFVEQLVQPFTSAAVAKEVALHFHSTVENEEYLFDADKLHTILSNLLSNAVKFTPAGGNIDISVNQETAGGEKETFRFQVKDSGIGITPEKLTFIFDRFYQADDSATRSYGGTGIGLALAKELAELMQGTLAVSSEKGLETVFTLSLSLAKAEGSIAPAYISPAPQAAFNPSTEISEPADVSTTIDAALKPLVLVVEDNEELNAFIAQTFRQHYRVLTAPNGIEGLKMANEELPDVIVSDWMMPGMDGVTLCSAVKTDANTNHIAFVLLTARSAPHSRIEGLQSKADDYLTKPFVAEELLLRVANILHRRQQLQRYFQQQLATPGAVGVTETALPAEQLPLHPFLQQLYGIVENHIDDTSFSVEHLARKAAVSTRTLSRKLHSIIDLPPAELIKQYRLQKAAELLKKGMGVAETTYQVGYESPTHFSAIFKTMYGVSPSEYVKEK